MVGSKSPLYPPFAKVGRGSLKPGRTAALAPSFVKRGLGEIWWLGEIWRFRANPPCIPPLLKGGGDRESLKVQLLLAPSLAKRGLGEI